MASPNGSDSAADPDVLLKAAALLQDNGQSTAMTLTAVERLNTGLGSGLTLVASWASLVLVSPQGRPTSVVPVSPTAMNMRRVAAAMAVIDQAEDGPLDAAEVERGIGLAATMPAAGVVAFAIACATGAGALAVIFGAHDARTVLLTAALASVGGLVRRGLGHFGAGPLLQVFAAAAIAGLGGSVAAGLGADAALVSVCPTMILVPGPHLLNGALDMLALRTSLGLARLGYATTIIAAIGAGLILGLTMTGQTLPTAAASAHVALLTDVTAAVVAAVSYAVYFSMPYRMMIWPAAAGLLAHAVHWWALAMWHSTLATAALLACVLVGALLVPLSHVLRIPFAGIGFAAIVSMVPGVYAFRALSGLTQLQTTASAPLVTETIADGAVAITVVAAMAVGVALPMRICNLAIARLERRRRRPPSGGLPRAA